MGAPGGPNHELEGCVSGEKERQRGTLGASGSCWFGCIKLRQGAGSRWMAHYRAGQEVRLFFFFKSFSKN